VNKQTLIRSFVRSLTHSLTHSSPHEVYSHSNIHQQTTDSLMPLIWVRVS